MNPSQSGRPVPAPAHAPRYGACAAAVREPGSGLGRAAPTAALQRSADGIGSPPQLRVRAAVIRFPTSFPRSLFTLLAATLPCLPGQQLADGWSSTVTALPAAAAAVLVTPAGVVYFDGTALLLLPPGQPPQPLLQLPGFAFGSFTIAAGPGRVLFGESSSGDLWLVPLGGPAPTQPIARLPLNYDAVLLGPDRALVSARTGGFAAPDNELVLVELDTARTRTIARFPGASGPLAIDADGDVYYATASAFFPPPPGATSVLRMPQSAIAGALHTNHVLGSGHVQTVLQGLDAAGDLAFDDDGDLWFTDYVNRIVGEIDDATGAAPSMGPVQIDYGAATVNGSALQFAAAGTPGGPVFEPFQPAGGSLTVFETDFVALAQLRTLTARRPTLTTNGPTPLPSGAFTLLASDGPRNGIGLLAFAPTPPLGERAFPIPGFEAPLWWDGAVLTGALVVGIPFDAVGDAALTVFNPGFQPVLSATVQVATIGTWATLGATRPLAVQLGP